MLPAIRLNLSPGADAGFQRKKDDALHGTSPVDGILVLDYFQYDAFTGT